MMSNGCRASLVHIKPDLISAAIEMMAATVEQTRTGGGLILGTTCAFAAQFELHVLLYTVVDGPSKA